MESSRWEKSALTDPERDDEMKDAFLEDIARKVKRPGVLQEGEGFAEQWDKTYIVITIIFCYLLLVNIALVIIWTFVCDCTFDEFRI